jgi:phosphoribosylformylglycinamidine synthase subunit PurS
VRFEATVEIRGVEGLADPEGQTIERALPALGFDGVAAVHVGRLVRFELEAADREGALATVQRLCDRLLVNPVIERATFSVEERA